MPTILINGVCLSEYQYICPKKQGKKWIGGFDCIHCTCLMTRKLENAST